MALITALVSFIGRQLSTIVQAILGWSVTALFGRLPSIKQSALAVALLLSLLWPIAVVGIFIPAVAAWAFAFLPLQKWFGPGPVRWATVGLAVIIPLAVGGVTRWVAPSPKQSPAKTLLSGYPLTLGYATACLITAVTVPLVKLGSVVRKWHDEHVFVQPREGRYADALRELVAACDAAEAPVRVETVPLRMRIASSVLNAMARNAVNAMMSQDPKMLRGDELELYLYPADLLLRGSPGKVARVRAAMTRTSLERYAFTVSDPKAQDIQTRLQELWARAESLPGRSQPRTGEDLRSLGRDLERAAVPYDQWVILDRSLHLLSQKAGLSDGAPRPIPSATPAGHASTAQRRESVATGQ